MGPRKRVKLAQNTSEGNRMDGQPTAQSVKGQGEDRGTPSVSSRRNGSPSSSIRSIPKLYGDSWPRISKALAVTQVARETITAASGKSPSHQTSLSQLHNRVDVASETATPSKSLLSSFPHQGSSSSRTPSKLNASSSADTEATNGGTGTAMVQQPREAHDNGLPETTELAKAHEDRALEPLSSAQKTVQDEGSRETSSMVTSGWLDWLPITRFTSQSIRDSNRPDGELSDRNPEPTVAPQRDSLGTKAAQQSHVETPNEQQPKGQTSVSPTGGLSQTQQYGTSWFGYWAKGGDQAGKAFEPADATKTQKKAVLESGEGGVTMPNESTTDPPLAVASSWAFWSKSSTVAPMEKSKEEQKGEVPINSTTEAVPRDASVAGQSKLRDDVSKKTDKEDVKRPNQETKSRSAVTVTEPALVSSTIQPPPPPSKQEFQKPASPNLLLPSFQDTYRVSTDESLLQQLTRLLLPGKHSPLKHVSLLPSYQSPRIKRALAIGVHGFFPAQFVRTFIGRPTGTSFKFASAAADAIRDFARIRSYECEVEAIALEGEGRIAERVDMLWKLTLKWIEKIQKADFILVACHSQGVPVAMMLVAKLIELGCISTARVGVCAMAGINLGPFPDYKSRFFSGSAGELFEFADSNSVVSKRYEHALRVAVKYGVRISYIGSLDDQLVSLESSIFSTISHPYIHRAVFIDGRVHTPDFITHLVGFALKLRNLGISDHGLIRELSAPLAGSLYTGEGHSRLYDDQSVYNLAIENALETSSVGDTPLHVQVYEPRQVSNNNPFFLPWAMRGLLEEEYVRTALGHETAQLLALFDGWRPTTKVLKDVKFRLEAVRSKSSFSLSSYPH